MSEISSSARIIGAVSRVGISPVGAVEADAPLASDNAPATPNAAVTAFLRRITLEVCFERDIASGLQIRPDYAPKQQSFSLRLVPENSLRPLSRLFHRSASSGLVRGKLSAITSSLQCEALMKVEGVYDCESDYDSDQAEAEDVPNKADTREDLAYTPRAD
jgi:hypothetical protein